MFPLEPIGFIPKEKLNNFPNAEFDVDGLKVDRFADIPLHVFPTVPGLEFEAVGAEDDHSVTPVDIRAKPDPIIDNHFPMAEFDVNGMQLDALVVPERHIAPTVGALEFEALGVEDDFSRSHRSQQVTRVATHARAYQPTHHYCYTGPVVFLSFNNDKKQFIEGVADVRSLTCGGAAINGNLVLLTGIVRRAKMVFWVKLKSGLEQRINVRFS